MVAAYYTTPLHVCVYVCYSHHASHNIPHIGPSPVTVNLHLCRSSHQQGCTHTHFILSKIFLVDLFHKNRVFSASITLYLHVPKHWVTLDCHVFMSRLLLLSARCSTSSSRRRRAVRRRWPRTWSWSSTSCAPPTTTSTRRHTSTAARTTTAWRTTWSADSWHR